MPVVPNPFGKFVEKYFDQGRVPGQKRRIRQTLLSLVPALPCGFLVYPKNGPISPDFNQEKSRALAR
jgi:hypothetical protein